jgi:hypothetical protein
MVRREAAKHGSNGEGGRTLLPLSPLNTLTNVDFDRHVEGQDSGCGRRRVDCGKISRRVETPPAAQDTDETDPTSKASRSRGRPWVFRGPCARERESRRHAHRDLRLRGVAAYAYHAALSVRRRSRSTLSTRPRGGDENRWGSTSGGIVLKCGEYKSQGMELSTRRTPRLRSSVTTAVPLGAKDGQALLWCRATNSRTSEEVLSKRKERGLCYTTVKCSVHGYRSSRSIPFTVIRAAWQKPDRNSPIPAPSSRTNCIRNTGVIRGEHIHHVSPGRE